MPGRSSGEPRRRRRRAASIPISRKGFIRAETIAFADFVAHGGEQGAKDAGRMRLEGADYIVQDGDIMHFRFNL